MSMHPSGSSDPYGYPPPRMPPYAARERGGCLTVWLTVSIGVNLLAGFLLCSTFSSVSSRAGSSLSPVSMGLIIVLVGLLIASLTCLWGIWNWKKWGVYGIAAISILSPLMEMAFGTATASDFIAPFVQLGILYYLIKDRWEAFE